MIVSSEYNSLSLLSYLLLPLFYGHGWVARIFHRVSISCSSIDYIRCIWAGLFWDILPLIVSSIDIFYRQSHANTSSREHSISLYRNAVILHTLHNFIDNSLVSLHVISHDLICHWLADVHCRVIRWAHRRIYICSILTFTAKLGMSSYYFRRIRTHCPGIIYS